MDKANLRFLHFCSLLLNQTLTYIRKSLTFSSTAFPPQWGDSSIYMGLMQQSNYHRLANRIYRRLLSCPDYTAQQVQEAGEMIDEWHKISSFCLQVQSVVGPGLVFYCASTTDPL